MSGTTAGGQIARDKNKKNYGADFYARIGAMGGKKSKGGFYNNPELARRAGAIGGAKSRRRPKAATQYIG